MICIVQHGFRGPITVLSKETYAPIDRTKLSKALVTDPSKLEWRSPADLKIKYGTILRTGAVRLSTFSTYVRFIDLVSEPVQEVTSVDFSAKTVTLGNGQETVNYGTLILASGGTPRRLPIEGSDLGSIFTLRGVQDAKQIDAGMSSSSVCMNRVSSIMLS
jgi:apoptosis-inducing factor 3